jgi:hypothetical protein
VIGRLHDDALLLDPRTIGEDQIEVAAAAVVSALRAREHA